MTEAENMSRWQDSGEPHRWVWSRVGVWCHDEFVSLLGPLGKQADFWGLVNLLMESVTASDLELFLDTEPSRPALARLFGEIRRGRVHRIIIRSLSDLCLTPEEVMRFAVEVTTRGVKVEQIFSLLPCALVRMHPELVGRYRHRQRIAKAIRLREAGLTVMEIASMIRASPSQVWRILSGFSDSRHCFRDDVTGGV